MTSTQTTDTAVRHFIAFAAEEAVPSVIYGIGHTADAAIEDAYQGSQTRPASMTWDGDAGEWTVTCHTSEETTTFTDENAAREQAASLGFTALECTDRLYERVQADGCAAGNPGYEWEQRDGAGTLYDLVQADWPAGVYDGSRRLDDEETLPSNFLHCNGNGGMIRYTYTGQSTYEAHDWDEAADAWVGTGSYTLDDDTTVEDFQVWADDTL